MIDNLLRDFTEGEFENFALTQIDRHNKLCKIIGEYEFDRRHFYVGVVLPYNDDRGCVSVTVIQDGKLNIIDTRYF